MAAFSPPTCAAYRDELVISTKAGYLMWPGPYGEWGSRKYVLASLDQSLRRMGLEYVDIFYSHRYDPNTPLEETMGALDTAVRSGRALYVGISSYGPQKTREAAAILRDLKTPFIIHQPSYSMLNRWIESELLDVLQQEGLGCIAFSPLAQGLLTSKYLKGVPTASRAAENGSFQKRMVSEKNLETCARWIESRRSAARAWRKWPSPGSCAGRRSRAHSIGASRWTQIAECLGALKNLKFSADELARIDRHALDGGLNIWAESSEHG